MPKSFVLKPNRGSAGAGILVFYGKKKGENAWIRPNGQVMTSTDIALHVEKDNPAVFLYEKLGFENKYLEMRLTR